MNSEDSPPERFVAIGGEFFSLGLLTDALEFYALGGYEEGLREVLAEAVDQGDLFVYRLAKKALGEAADEEELTRLAQNGVKAGKLVYAKAAFEEAGAHDKASGLMRDELRKKRGGKLH